MKKLRIVLIGLLLAGAVALVGCSRYDTANESQGKGRNSEVAGRSLEQSGRGGSSSTQEQGNRGAGRNGNSQAQGNFSVERYGRAQDGTTLDGRFQDLDSNTPEQSGKSVVDRGSISNIAGALQYDGSEWYLSTDKDRYILHFGNSAYVESTGIDLREGETIEVRGFLSGDEIAVVAVRVGSQVFAFRNENGMPLWAGSGRRENQVVQPYSRGSGSEQPRGQSSNGDRGGRGRGQGTEGGAFDRQGPESGSEQPGGRGRQLDDSQELPWWYQQPLDSEDSQTQT